MLVYLGYKGLKAWAIGNLVSMQQNARQDRDGITDEMVKDPYCSVYFPKRQGIHLRAGGEDLYFCSPECRDKYLKK